MTAPAYDLDAMTRRPDHYGFGYLGNSCRSGWSDDNLVEAAKELGLTEARVFEWANSVGARHFIEGYSRWQPPAVEDFREELTRP